MSNRVNAYAKHFSSALILFLMAFALFLILRTSPAPATTLQLIGYTNAPTGTKLAIFRLTNRDNKTFVTWRNGFVECKERQPVQAFSTGGLPVDLHPGESELITVPVSGSGQPWRVRTVCTWDGYRHRFSRWLGTMAGQRLQPFVPKVMRAAPNFYIASDWIE